MYLIYNILLYVHEKLNINIVYFSFKTKKKKNHDLNVIYFFQINLESHTYFNLKIN